METLQLQVGKLYTTKQGNIYKAVIEDDYGCESLTDKIEDLEQWLKVKFSPVYVGSHAGVKELDLREIYTEGQDFIITDKKYSLSSALLNDKIALLNPNLSLVWFNDDVDQNAYILAVLDGELENRRIFKEDLRGFINAEFKSAYLDELVKDKDGSLYYETVDGQGGFYGEEEATESILDLLADFIRKEGGLNNE